MSSSLARSPESRITRIIGVFRRGSDGGRIDSADRRDRRDFAVSAREAEGVEDGELVVAEEIVTRRYGPPQARITEKLGSAEAPGAFSLLAIAQFDIPEEFPAAALKEAAEAGSPESAGRVDLRALGLVTIDGPDARDFDDAVWAEPDLDPANPGGWHIVVAIADVAWYVRADGALDREAARRGNSVYFPDRVVPMLPEALSNGLCSLVPGEDRACLVAQIWLGADGRKRRHRFERALMRSAARLTYEGVQAAQDDAGVAPVPRERLAALYGAFAVLDRARIARGALALDLPEHKVLLDPARKPVAIVEQPRLDSHRLIEEFMILANVAAAEELEARHRACVYRVHDLPDPEKVEALRDFLIELHQPGLALAKGERVRPELFNRVLTRAAGTQEAPLINDLVLRAQAQAVYSPRNIGHFGLALARYAHFTSPIRRYADLLVHRALLGELPRQPEELEPIAEHISFTERRAASAERAAFDRYRTVLLAGAVGSVLSGRVTGVGRFGLFVTVAETGADGLIPISTLPADFYRHDARRHRLVGQRTRRVFALGDEVKACLEEADPISGRLSFRLDDAEPPPTPRKPSPRNTRGRR
ncbi:MAG TPA: VacB/RNase II family 3'-5' exoribonuclease [Stellaceae bacterium]